MLYGVYFWLGLYCVSHASVTKSSTWTPKIAIHIWNFWLLF